jgi:uncharacterized protein YhjY with autotransporter beta-barrel domain
MPQIRCISHQKDVQIITNTVVTLILTKGSLSVYFLFVKRKEGGMKKVILIALFLQLCIIPAAYSASIVDSVQPLGNMNIGAAVEDNFIFERDLDGEGSTTDAEASDTNQVYGKLMVGWSDYFNVYTKLGAVTGSKYKFTKPRIYEYDTDAGFLWGFGLSGAYEFIENWKIAGDIQYNSWQIDVDSGRYVGEAMTNIGTPGVDNHELQATGLILADFTIKGMNAVFTPYAGVGYVYYKTETDGTITFSTASTNSASDSWSVEGDDLVSIVTGISVKMMDDLKAYAEGRFIAETAITAGLSYSF